MYTKHYLVISGIVGGVIGSLLTALLVSPVTAQRDKFDTLQCSKLEVVDANGVARVVLKTNENSGDIGVYGEDGDEYVSINSNHNSGGLYLQDSKGYYASLHFTGVGGKMQFGEPQGNPGFLGRMLTLGLLGSAAYLRTFSDEKIGIQLSNASSSGVLQVYSYDDNGLIGEVELSHDPYGGAVIVMGEDGKLASLCTDHNGGVVVALGKATHPEHLPLAPRDRNKLQSWLENIPGIEIVGLWKLGHFSEGAARLYIDGQGKGAVGTWK
ncbi:MAG: hypothetical protein OXP71_04750 [Candidatus Poribacteria bacterium]|nr:hypothetical protein [Candidatus Poribacteria bacterium]